MSIELLFLMIRFFFSGSFHFTTAPQNQALFDIKSSGR